MELVETMDVEFLIVYSLIRVRWFDLLTIKDKKNTKCQYEFNYWGNVNRKQLISF